MRALFFGIILFIFSFLLQIIIWKINIPKRQNKVLLQIFFGTLIIGLIALYFTSYVNKISEVYATRDMAEYLYIIILFTSLTLAYMITYSAIEVDSPSLLMIIAIAETGTEGLSERKFKQSMNDNLLIKPRLNDLILDKMVYLENGKYKLTSKGIMLSRLFVIYRRIIKAEKGG